MAKKDNRYYASELFSEEDFTIEVGTKIDTLEEVLDTIIQNQGAKNELSSKNKSALGSGIDRTSNSSNRLGSNGESFEQRAIQLNDEHISQGYGRGGGLRYDNNALSDEYNRTMAQTASSEQYDRKGEQGARSERFTHGSTQTREQGVRDILQATLARNEADGQHRPRDTSSTGDELGLGILVDEEKQGSRHALRESSRNRDNARELSANDINKTRNLSSTKPSKKAREYDLFSDENLFSSVEQKPNSRILAGQNTEIQREFKIISTGVNEDFKATSENEISGKKDKFRKNIEAIRLTKELASIKQKAKKAGHNFTITKGEQEIISKFSGWGSLPEVFDENKTEWKNEQNELKALLSPSEYESAKSSVLTAFYTPKIVIDSMYKGLERLGINNTDEKKEILEPAAGNGAFLAFNKNENFSFTTIELEKTSHDMLSLLYPNQKHYHNGFEEISAKDKQFDAVIGNPPYSQIKLFDNEEAELNGMSIHNFFAAKSAKYMLKDDGVMAFITSSYFMDAKDHSVRAFISENATFLGALRLSNSTFKNAGTEVSTDIVFFKKGKEPSLEKAWLNVADMDRVKYGEFENYSYKWSINEYFKNNPQNILAKPSLESSQYGLKVEFKEDNSLDLNKKLDEFIESLPKDVYKYHKQELKESVVSFEKSKLTSYYDELKANNYFELGGELYLKLKTPDDEVIKATKLSVSKSAEQRIKNFIKLRDSHKELITLEKMDISDDDPRLIKARTTLNEAYDNYHKNGDFLHNTRKNSEIKQDVDSPKIIALEQNYQKGISPQSAAKMGLNAQSESAQKAKILSKRVIRPTAVMSFENAEDGLFASMNTFGKPNIEYIATNLNKEPELIASELLGKKLIFIEPKKLLEKGEKEYIFGAKYLSGDVREKERIALEVSKFYKSEMKNNLEALKEVIPTDLKAGDIDVGMGASWVPLDVYSEFFENKFGISKENFTLTRTNFTGEWLFDGNQYAVPLYNRQKYSTTEKSVFEIAVSALQNNPIIIKKDSDIQATDKNGEPKFDERGNPVYKKIVDQEKTDLANEKVEALKDEFEGWIFEDQERRERLCRIYNDKFNCYAKKTYDGSKISLDKLNEHFILRKHQKDAIFRAINEQNVLFDHEVGAGKTLASICSVMKQKELGIINKPLIAVPNHLVGQWSDEFISAFPDANLLVADEKSLSPAKRDEFFGKIMNGDYDAIIIKHSQIEKIPVPPAITKKVIDKQIMELKEAIEFNEKEEGSKLSVKRLQTRIENLEKKLESVIKDSNKTKSIDFSDLGVDCLVVDESHMYKNLPFSSHLKVKGLGNQAGSNKALAMFGFTSYMNDNNKKILFLTGTPISNSLSELYNVQKYLMPSELENKGLTSFDAWASVYAKTENVAELNAGNGYDMVTRLTALRNLPEISAAYTDVAHIVTNDDIKKHYKHYVPPCDVIENVAPSSKEVELYIEDIIRRMEKMKTNYDPREDNMLKATNDAKKAGIDYRLIDPDARDYDNSKVNLCVKNIVAEYHNSQEQKGTQLVFLDIGCPKNPSEFSYNLDLSEEPLKKEPAKIEPIKEEFKNINEVIESDDVDQSVEADRSDDSKFFLYADIYKKLVKSGIPREQIAFIHDSENSISKKQELFRKVNNGEVRVLIGSTAKMGAGTNVQERAIAIHHLDVPWRPSDLTQRNGRIIRQGNALFEKDPENFRVKEFRYVTHGTYDAVCWQIQESKSTALLNFRKGVIDGRSLEGFEEQAASAAEMKAAATGNPLVLDQVKLQDLEKKEKIKYKNFQKQTHEAEDKIVSLGKKIEFFEQKISDYNKTKQIVAEHKSNNFKCSLILNDISAEPKKTSFEIQKGTNDDLTKNQQKQMEEIFSKQKVFFDMNIKGELDFMEYKGFIARAYKEDNGNISFALRHKESSLVLTPDNLDYVNKTDGTSALSQLNLHGFIQRVNNYLSDERIDIAITNNANFIQKAQNDIKGAKEWLAENPKYPRQEFFELVKKEHEIVKKELDKMSKNKEYKSPFKSKALAMINTKTTSKNVAIEQTETKIDIAI